MTKVYQTAEHSSQTANMKLDENENMKKKRSPQKKQTHQKHFSRDKSSRKHITVDAGSSKSIRNPNKTNTFYKAGENDKRISNKESYLKHFQR